LHGIVLLVDDSDLSRIIHNALAREFRIDAVVREAKVSRSTFLRKRLKRLGWRTVTGQILFAKCIVPLLKLESTRRRADIFRQYGLDEAPIPKERVIDVRSVNEAQNVALLQKLSPKVIVVNGTRILEWRLLHATNAVFLNNHVGITPLYRGVHGGYWALASGDLEHFGATIHKVDTGIDTGDIVAQALTKPADADNFCTYPLLQIAISIPLLKQAIRDAVAGNVETMPAPAGDSKLWSHPTAFRYVTNRITHGIR
jgi:folate-dependent phosphoribosylglycinamide formyltransferase PurN